ncbi:MAG: AAA family ATPase [Syntrophomonadaceae bacterium]
MSQNKVFRVFVSSTFSDFETERNALQDKVFPKIQKFCEIKGFIFQAIDLRWGVSEDAALDQQTMKICLNELKRCQELTPRPNFIVLLGDRYGWQPLPSRIEASEFQDLIKVVPEGQKEELYSWYIRDDNAVPPEFCLQSRRNYANLHPNNCEFDDAKWTDVIEPQLHSILLNAAKLIYSDPEDPRLNKYRDSATHQEIRFGALSTPDPKDQVLAYFRETKGLSNSINIEDHTDEDTPESRLKALKNTLRKELPPNHIYDYSGQLDNDQLNINIEAFCERVELDLLGIIQSEMENYIQISEHDLELEGNKENIARLTDCFVGREDVLSKVFNYFEGNNNHILLISGVSGTGKSALLAQISKSLLETEITNSKGKIVIPYFVGATPSSTDIRYLLDTICKQIKLAYGDESTAPEDYSQLAKYFSQILQLASVNHQLIIIIDGLDILDSSYGAKFLNWLPNELPSNVKLVVSAMESSDEDGEILQNLMKIVPVNNTIQLEKLSVDQGEAIIDFYLNKNSRCLQEEQRIELLEKMDTNGLPLYIRLLVNEVMMLKSYQTVEISSDVTGIMKDIFERMEDPVNHGFIFVSRALSYLAAGRYGLTEDELVTVLSQDEVVINDFRIRSPKSPIVNGLPILVWSRLHYDIDTYLLRRKVDNNVLISFYHKEIRQLVNTRYINKSNIDIHKNLAYYFYEKADPDHEHTWTGTSRSLLELPYQLLKTNDLDALDIMVQTDFLERKAKLFGYTAALDDAGSIAEAMEYAGDDYWDQLVRVASIYAQNVVNLRCNLDSIEGLTRMGDLTRLIKIINFETNSNHKDLLLLAISTLLKESGHISAAMRIFQSFPQFSINKVNESHDELFIIAKALLSNNSQTDILMDYKFEYDNNCFSELKPPKVRIPAFTFLLSQFSSPTIFSSLLGNSSVSFLPLFIIMDQIGVLTNGWIMIMIWILNIVTIAGLKKVSDYILRKQPERIEKIYDELFKSFISSELREQKRILKTGLRFPNLLHSKYKNKPWSQKLAFMLISYIDKCNDPKEVGELIALSTGTGKTVCDFLISYLRESNKIDPHELVRILSTETKTKDKWQLFRIMVYAFSAYIPPSTLLDLISQPDDYSEADMELDYNYAKKAAHNLYQVLTNIPKPILARTLISGVKKQNNKKSFSLQDFQFVTSRINRVLQHWEPFFNPISPLEPIFYLVIVIPPLVMISMVVGACILATIPLLLAVGLSFGSFLVTYMERSNHSYMKQSWQFLQGKMDMDAKDNHEKIIKVLKKLKASGLVESRGKVILSTMYSKKILEAAKKVFDKKQVNTVRTITPDEYTKQIERRISRPKYLITLFVSLIIGLFLLYLCDVNITQNEFAIIVTIVCLNAFLHSNIFLKLKYLSFSNTDVKSLFHDLQFILKVFYYFLGGYLIPYFYDKIVPGSFTFVLVIWLWSVIYFNILIPGLVINWQGLRLLFPTKFQLWKYRFIWNIGLLSIAVLFTFIISGFI